jgi:hypothetical protein
VRLILIIKSSEDLNVLVKRHISSVVSSSPSKAIATLEHDAAELISAGMVTLNAKLSGADDDSLIGRIVDVWSFFWDQVLTYVEGVLLVISIPFYFSPRSRFCFRYTLILSYQHSTAASRIARPHPVKQARATYRPPALCS